MTRTERQLSAIEKWIKAGGQNTIVAFTGFGKSRLATTLSTRFITKYPDVKIIIVVPTQVLKEQWETELIKCGIEKNHKVEIINTVIKYNWDCDLLIIDEAHRCGSIEFRKVFTCVNYNKLLCLTATVERLDGLEKVIEHYAPICDEVTLEEGLKNDWVAEYQEYKVLLDVDLTEYKKINSEFLKHFSFFNYDLTLALRCVQFPPTQNTLANKLGVPLNSVKAHTYSFMRLLRERKEWVMNHPQKIKIAKDIISYRQDKKILTFSSSIKLAKLLGSAHIIHSKIPKVKRKTILDDFKKQTSGVLSSVDALREGMDVPGVSTAILLGFNSSMLKKVQTVGRVIRKEEDKKAEVFTLVIKGTIEEQWFAKSSKNVSYLTIDENDLNNLLTNTCVKQEDVLYFE